MWNRRNNYSHVTPKTIKISQNGFITNDIYSWIDYTFVNHIFCSITHIAAFESFLSGCSSLTPDWWYVIWSFETYFKKLPTCICMAAKRHKPRHVYVNFKLTHGCKETQTSVYIDIGNYKFRVSPIDTLWREFIRSNGTCFFSLYWNCYFILFLLAAITTFMLCFLLWLSVVLPPVCVVRIRRRARAGISFKCSLFTQSVGDSYISCRIIMASV